MSEGLEFDPAKDVENRAQHGLALDSIPVFDEEPLIKIDDRMDYGEVRYNALGRIGGKGHVATFVLREGLIRMINFRRAHEKEMRRHGR